MAIACQPLGAVSRTQHRVPLPFLFEVDTDGFVILEHAGIVARGSGPKLEVDSGWPLRNATTRVNGGADFLEDGGKVYRGLARPPRFFCCKTRGRGLVVRGVKPRC